MYGINAVEGQLSTDAGRVLPASTFNPFVNLKELLASKKRN